MFEENTIISVDVDKKKNSYTNTLDGLME